MTDEIKELIDSFRRGKYEDRSEKISLLAQALGETPSDLELIKSLLSAPQIGLRLAAIEACQCQDDTALLNLLCGLVKDHDVRIRRKLAQILPTLPNRQFTEMIEHLAGDEDDEVRLGVIKATANTPSLFALQRSTLANDSNSNVRLAAAEAMKTQKFHAIAAEFFTSLVEDENEDVQAKCAELLESKLVKDGPACEKVLPGEIALIERAHRNLKELQPERFPNLLDWLVSKSFVQVTSEELEQFGTDLTAVALDGMLPRASSVDKIRDLVVSTILGKEARSVLLLGEAGVGKSAIINEVVYELLKPENGGWRVLRVSPSDFLVGTRYLGEWETRVNNLVDTVRRPRRVVLYVPNLSDLSTAGTHEHSNASVATALAPYIEDGSIILLGESTPAEFNEGLGAIPSLNRLFTKLLISPATEEQTRKILTDIRDQEHTQLDDSILDQLLEISGQYISQPARPGNAIKLLKETIYSCPTGQISPRNVLDALSRSTGIPAAFLDDSIPLDLHAVRSFFEHRVMGQSEAVDAVIDLITLIKAGLTDPEKPFGIFLFVGPTGVGKTELARALAEFVFGDASKLQRFDMSEFASEEGYERLIGIGHRHGLLTDAVRQKPFSVVLLDEIEKSHLNVFDICLQLFDAGRLTDGRGRTVDFRRTILVLTSNIGASAPGTFLGFNAVSQQNRKSEPDQDKTFRELSRFFRPEFLNRIDRIINFRPLSIEVAENLAKREVNQVLQRQGISRRHLALDIDPSVISLLVREGYSPSFGARPLKRAVERHLLLPLARAIAAGNIAGRSLVRITVNTSNRLDVRVVNKVQTRVPDDVQPKSSLTKLSESLLDRLESLEEQVVYFCDRKDEILQETHQPEFYQDKIRRSAAFAELHRLDQFLSTCEGLSKAVNGIHNLLVQHRVKKTEEQALLDRLQQLSCELDHLCLVATSNDAQDLSDVLISVQLVDRSGNESIEGVEKLVNMYLGFARRRRLSAEVLSEFACEREDCAYIQVVGLGGYILFKNEVGLHELELIRPEKASTASREKRHPLREIIRVDLLSMDKQPDKAFSSRLKLTEMVRPKKVRFLKKPCFEVSLFHEPSLRSFRGCLSGEKESALANAQLILFSQLSSEADPRSQNAEQIVRQYILGPAGKIKDARTGRTINRTDQVLKGHLDLFLSEHSLPN